MDMLEAFLCSIGGTSADSNGASRLFLVYSYTIMTICREGGAGGWEFRKGREGRQGRQSREGRAGRQVREDREAGRQGRQSRQVGREQERLLIITGKHAVIFVDFNRFMRNKWKTCS